MQTFERSLTNAVAVAETVPLTSEQDALIVALEAGKTALSLSSAHVYKLHRAGVVYGNRI